MSERTLDSLGVSAFCESMGMLVRAGIPNDEAITLLQSEEERAGGVLGQGLAVMKARVDEGDGLAAAMEASGIFPAYALRMTAAAEDTGRLEDILFRLSRYYADQAVIAEKLRGAVSYPAAMLGLIIAVLAVMLSMVLPAFAGVYDRLTGSLSASTYGYIRWAYAFCWIALIALALVAAALVAGLFLWKRGRRAPVERVLRRIPLCARLMDGLGMLRFTSALSTFLASGELQDEAVLRSIPMAECPPVEARLNRCARHMEQGHSIAQAAYEESLFEPVYGRMLLAGERSGELESVLDRLSGLMEENCAALTDRLVSVVDPLLSGILMITVGLSLLSIILPLIGMMSSIG